MKRLIVAFILVLLLAFPAYAQTNQATPQSEPTHVSYQKPKLGLLPNSSFYRLQIAWDRLMLLLTKNHDKKALMYIDLADKELTAASQVIEQGNLSSGLHSAFRGEHYMTLFVNTMKELAYNSGGLNSEIVARAHAAYPYHQEVIQTMINKTDGDTQTQLKSIFEFSQRNDAELKLLEQEYKLPDRE